MSESIKLYYLKDIGDIFSGNSINAKIKKEKYTDLVEGMPYIATKDISYDSFINYENGISIPDSDLESFRIATKNSVLICAEGGSAGRKIGILDKNVCFVNKLFALLPNEKAIGKYIFYWYQTNTFQKDFKKELTGLIGGVSKSKFQNLTIPIPEIDLQKQIVEILDKTFESIEKVKENIEKNIENTRELFESRLNEVFSQKGKGWEEKKLYDLCDNGKKDIVDGPFGSNLKREHFIDYGISVLKIQNVKPFQILHKKMDYVSEEKYKELKRHSYQAGDIVMTKLGNPLGASAIVPENEFGLIVADLVRIRVSKVNVEYLCYHLNSKVTQDIINSQQKGATRPRVKIVNVRDLPINVPSLKKQKEIVNEISKFEEYTNELKEKYQQKLENLEELKKSILQKAFSGELI